MSRMIPTVISHPPITEYHAYVYGDLDNWYAISYPWQSIPSHDLNETMRTPSVRMVVFQPILLVYTVHDIQ